MFVLLSAPSALQGWLGGGTGPYVVTTIAMAVTAGMLAAWWPGPATAGSLANGRPERGRYAWITVTAASAAVLLFVTAHTWIGEILTFPIDPQLLGSSDFTLQTPSPLSLLTPLQSVSFNVVYKPTTTSPASALIAIPYSYTTPLAYVRTNVEGTVNLLEAAAIVPTPARSIDEPTAVERLRVRLESAADFEGVRRLDP